MFKGVSVCLDVFRREIGERREREREREFAQKLPRNFFFGGKMSGLEAFIAKNDLSAAGAPCRAASHLVDISNFGLVSVQI